MDVLVRITKYILGCYHHFTVCGTSFHSDNFYITTLHICSQKTAFWCFYGRNAVPPCILVAFYNNNNIIFISILYRYTCINLINIV